MALDKYNEKRNFKKTKEPVGKMSSHHKKLHFVVQHHLASKEHYDFRLEWSGVLKSWAVPKGPSFDPKDKRLAVQVEDHPYSYRNFEGIIPKGQYGGGTVMLFDEGYWYPLNDVNFKKGSFKFFLDGKRFKGIWTLVYMKEDMWLLIKEKDEYVKKMNIKKWTTSIKTGKRVKEIENPNMITLANLNKIPITSPDKIIIKKPKISKLDIVNYYKKVWKRMLPYMQDRIISTIRCPNGSEGDCFFKKHLETKSSGLGRIYLQNNHEKKDYYYVKNAFGLIDEVQMNSFEFHVWGSKVNQLNYPDILVFDLDPDENLSLLKVRNGVKDLKKILDDLHLNSYLKTSGGKGYHVVVPIKNKMTWKEARDITKNIASLMEQKYPDLYTSNMNKEKRKGKIYIDWVRNTKGATSVAPYSIRIRKKATVSMPIKWSELDKVKPDDITIEKALKRLKRKDPWEGFFD